MTCILLVAFGAIFLYKSYALYEEKKDFNVINGQVEEPGDLYFAYYVNGTISKDVPTKDSGLTLDTTKSSCNSGVTVSWDDDNWHAILDYSTYESNSTTRTKCTLYFKEKSYCELNPNAAHCQILALVKDNDKSSTDVYTVPNKTSDTCTYTLAYDGTSDNNLRYVGKNPCNYVTFNGEKAGWRIIGILNTPEGQRMKLIRTNSLGNLSWDYTSTGSCSNDWTTSTLQTLLNSGAYYNRTTGQYYNNSTTATTLDFTSNGLTEVSKNQIDTITWKLGGTANYNSSSNGLASHWYTYERGTTIYTGRPTEWPGKVGLMYPSDYGYATSGGSTSTRTSCLVKELYNWDSSSYSDCKNNDWLFDSSTPQWTLAPYSSNSTAVFSVYSAGVVRYYIAYLRIAVRPSVYLISKTSILGGEGTLENPYEIG